MALLLSEVLPTIGIGVLTQPANQLTGGFLGGGGKRNIVVTIDSPHYVLYCLYFFPFRLGRKNHLSRKTHA